MKYPKHAIAALAALLAVAGCQSNLRFALPTGNASVGKEVFAKYRCADCHVIAGMEHLRAGVEPLMTLRLGGETDRIETYDDLLVSVVNPSHVISKNFPGVKVSEGGKSKMPNYNDVMSVTELVDLFAYLQSQYTLKEFEPIPYPDYWAQMGPY
ncbi:MAG: c-type cytochrome [Rhodospirillaceae bacterium]|nr:c-type cytochrome [Rhodospirillaceae bacterium]